MATSNHPLPDLLLTSTLVSVGLFVVVSIILGKCFGTWAGFEVVINRQMNSRTHYQSQLIQMRCWLFIIAIKPSWQQIFFLVTCQAKRKAAIP